MTAEPITPQSVEAALAEVLDAIGDDEVYADARRALLYARDVLRRGTTAEVHGALQRAWALLDEACPIDPEL
ncbi:hypothetical protein [Streptomyces misionensis]|uniref:hypothetical protein n=1 Tax=Streptomyces misionensis TaxID=67331 RepID=UPI0036A61B2B